VLAVFDPMPLRDDRAPPGLVVVRLGVRTLDDDLLGRSVAECHHRWGIWGFSVLEVPDGDYALLARLRPNVSQRRQLLIADGADLIEDGFPLLPTLDAPHWTVMLAAPLPVQFARARAHFRGPIDNPAYRNPYPRRSMISVEMGSYDLWYDATSVGADLVVETWISHGPRHADPAFDPQPGDWVLVGDDEEPPVRSRVVRRVGNRVWVQLDLGLAASTAVGGQAQHR
jgi:hypothetical protein